MSTNFVDQYFDEVSQIAKAIDRDAIERMVFELAELRDRGGRLFIIGVGGSAGNCAHAVNDFRKLCDIEAYAPTDNVSELTARTNDEGWETVFEGWLKVSKIGPSDGLLVFSVGGGDVVNNVSVNIVKAIDFAKLNGLKVLGIVGIETGYACENGDEVIVVPVPEGIIIICTSMSVVVLYNM